MHRNEFETAGVDHKSYVGVACAEPKESVPSLLNETVASKLKIRNISFFFFFFKKYVIFSFAPT